MANALRQTSGNCCRGNGSICSNSNSNCSGRGKWLQQQRHRSSNCGNLSSSCICRNCSNNGRVDGGCRADEADHQRVAHCSYGGQQSTSGSLLIRQSTDQWVMSNVKWQQPQKQLFKRNINNFLRASPIRHPLPLLQWSEIASLPMKGVQRPMHHC